MAAVQEGVIFVRIFFYAKNTISAKRKKALVALAYQTARDQLLAPKEILIRLVVLLFPPGQVHWRCTFILLLGFRLII